MEEGGSRIDFLLLMIFLDYNYPEYPSTSLSKSKFRTSSESAMPTSLPSPLSISEIPRHSRRSLPTSLSPRAYTREVYFNNDLSTTKKLQAGVDLVTDLLGLTLGPKGRNVVLENKFGPPTIVNDGETILKEVELQDPVENVGVKLVRQAAAKTNEIAGDGSTTAIVLARGLIDEGVKVIAAGMNPIQIVYGIEKTAKALVSELRLMSREIKANEIADVAAVSAGNDYTVGNMIAYALQTVGQNGFIRIETGRGTENSLEVVRGMQFERGYLSPYFITDRATMSTEFNDCKILLVDKIITNPKEILKILDEGVKGNYPLLVIAEGVDEDALAPIIRNKLKGLLKVAVIKAPAFGERKSDYLDDIAILTGADRKSVV